MLQVNLCNSGRAACYTGGRAVGMVMGLVHQWRPGMLTLNEVCRDDVGVLKQAMSAAFPAAKVASAFASARNDIGDGPVRCRNGQEFGDGVLVVERPSALGLRSNSGVYPVQDPGDFEQRAWVCLDVDGGFLACTTHTASTNATVALGQCRYLLASVVPGHDPRAGGHPVVVGADLNLTARGAPSPEACLPSGYQRTDDGGVQDVIVGPGIRVPSRWVIDMRGTTDHPGLLVDVLISRR
ncbi:MAG TPA: hypothetical protein VFM07_07695 [Intrasporangium sp.]|nr:hypothetical protein [Intrasporangium sp.]